MPPSCSRAAIFGGVVAQPIRPDWAGQAACIKEFLQTSTSILSETGFSTTVVKTLMALVTVTTTSSLAAPINTQAVTSAPWWSSNSTDMDYFHISTGATSVHTAGDPYPSYSNVMLHF